MSLGSKIGTEPLDEHLVRLAKECVTTKPWKSKAWMITATRLFPQNFDILHERYLMTKSSKDAEEAARLFSSLYETFQSKAEVWAELEDILLSVQGSASGDSRGEMDDFYRKLFSLLPENKQYQMLHGAACQRIDVLDQTRFMLVLIGKFPATIQIHGKQMYEAVLIEEGRKYPRTAINPCREMVIFEIFPRILDAKDVSLSSEDLVSHFRIVLQYVFARVSSGASACTRTGITHSWTPLSRVVQAEGNPWEEGLKLLSGVAQRLQWTALMNIGARSSLTTNWEALAQVVIKSAKFEDIFEIVYTCVVLLLQCVLVYQERILPPMGSKVPPLALVEGLIGYRRPRKETRHPERVSLTIDNAYLSSAAVKEFLDAFQVGCKCLHLLHSKQSLQNQFSEIWNELLQAGSWYPYSSFLVDRLLFMADYQSTSVGLTQLWTLGPSPQAATGLKLRKLCVAFILRQHQEFLSVALELLGAPLKNSDEYERNPTIGATVGIYKGDAGLVLEQSETDSSKTERSSRFTSLTSKNIFRYVVALITSAFREEATSLTNSETNDAMLSHLLVLIQHDWPRTSFLFQEILRKIISQNSLDFPQFFQYVVTPDILEEIAHLYCDDGMVVKANFPDSTSTTTGSPSKRNLGTRGSKHNRSEEFKAACIGSMYGGATSKEPLLLKFLMEERNRIVESLDRT